MGYGVEERWKASILTFYYKYTYLTTLLVPLLVSVVYNDLGRPDLQLNWTAQTKMPNPDNIIEYQPVR